MTAEEAASDAYQKVITKGYRPYPEGEKAISGDAGYAFLYASNVIKGRWEPGEAAIATELPWAYKYARGVIRGRWEPSENIISKYAHYTKAYIEMVLKSDEKYKTDPDFMAWVLANA